MKTKHLTLILFASLILTPALHAKKVVLQCSDWKNQKYYAQEQSPLIALCEAYIKALCDKIKVNSTGTLNGKPNGHGTLSAFIYMVSKNLPVEKIKALSPEKAQEFFDLISKIAVQLATCKNGCKVGIDCHINCEHKSSESLVAAKNLLS